MKNIAKCLREIEKVKEVAEGEAIPYAARSRIARLTLDTTRWSVGLYPCRCQIARRFCGRHLVTTRRRLGLSPPATS